MLCRACGKRYTPEPCGPRHALSMRQQAVRLYLEGMSFGLPAIGTTCGGAREIIADGVNGYLVPPNDAAAVAHCLMNLAANRPKLARMSLAARERFLAQPGWNASMAGVRQALLNWAGNQAGTA